MEENKDTVITENGKGQEQNQEQQDNNAKTYTQEEVLALIQSEADKRVNQALATQQKKFDKQLSLSKLDGNEREKAEKDEQIAELKEMVAQFTVEKNRSELKSVLSARGLSAEFADIVNVSDDLEESQKNIDKLDKLFKAAVKTEVEKRIAGNVPKGNGKKPNELTQEDAKKMSMAEMNKLLETNPELFNKLFN